EHPDWVLAADGAEVGMVDFGHPDARAWAVQLLSEAIESWGVGWLKWDFIVKEPRCHLKDERRELAHIRGVYAVVDEVRRRHPELIVEMCASGGNRIDLE